MVGTLDEFLATPMSSLFGRESALSQGQLMTGKCKESEKRARNHDASRQIIGEAARARQGGSRDER